LRANGDIQVAIRSLHFRKTPLTVKQLDSFEELKPDPCAYCLNIPGVGPKPRDVAPNLFEQPVSESPNVVIVPDLGMLVPGCFLAVSKQHVFSYAHFSTEHLDELELYVHTVTDRLARSFDEYFIFEHGACERSTNSYGGCITHAHLHLTPAARQAGARILSALNFEELSTFSAVASQTEFSYALLGLGKRYFLARNPKLPGQWIRRVVVESLNLTRHWDWAVETGEKELETTLTVLERDRFDV